MSTDPTGQQRLPGMLSGAGEEVNRVVDPEDRMPRYYGGAPPPKTELKDQIKKDVRKAAEKLQDVAEGVERGTKKVGEKIGDAAYAVERGVERGARKVGEAVQQVGHKTWEAGKKIQHKVEDVVDDIRHSRFPWLHVVVAGVIVLVAVKILRTQATTTTLN